MVSLIVGQKGKGKTKELLDRVNADVKNVSGNIVYLDKDTAHMYELNNKIRLIELSSFPIRNSDEFIGFICGIISQDHDIELIFIDSILKHADVKLEDLEEFLGRLAAISEIYGPDFVVSISADAEEIGSYVNKYEILNPVE